MQKLLQSSWANNCLCLWMMESQLSGTLLSPYVDTNSLSQHGTYVMRHSLLNYFACHSESVYRSVWAACRIIFACCVDTWLLNHVLAAVSLVHSNRQVIPSQTPKSEMAWHRAITASPITMQMQSECFAALPITMQLQWECIAVLSTGWASLTTDLATTARHSCGLWDIKPPGKMQQQGPSSATFWMEVERGLSLLCPWCHHKLSKQHT